MTVFAWAGIDIVRKQKLTNTKSYFIHAPVVFKDFPACNLLLIRSSLNTFKCFPGRSAAHPMMDEAHLHQWEYSTRVWCWGIPVWSWKRGRCVFFSPCVSFKDFTALRSCSEAQKYTLSECWPVTHRGSSTQPKNATFVFMAQLSGPLCPLDLGWEQLYYSNNIPKGELRHFEK